jgi:hypothetical protein
MSKPNSTQPVQPQPQTPQINTSKTAGAAAPSKQAIVTQTDNGYRLPSSETLAFAVKLSISEDKPIMMDYWTSSIDKTVLIGHKTDGVDKKNAEKMLVRSEEEYTSPISKIYKQGEDDIIIVTENSIYIVDAKIPSRRISA